MKKGEILNFSGKVLVFRDIIMRKILDGKIKIDLKNKFVFFCGPLIKKNKILACGPTTSKRMEYGIPYLLENGVKGVIGKGYLDQKIFKNKGVYLLAVGGAGSFIASKIKNFKILKFPELGPEALFEFEIENLPLLVGIDKRGRSIFKDV